MKTTKIFFSILFIFTTISINAQLSVLAGGEVKSFNQTVVQSKPGHISDGFDITGNNASLPSGCDLIWGYYYVAQPTNPGLFTIGSVDGACFTVRANGKVGIFNSNPSTALEVGTAGTDYQIKVNGSIVQTSDERLKDNIKDLSSSIDQLKQLRTVSYNYKQPQSTQKVKGSISSDSITPKKPNFIPKSEVSTRVHFGFLAQDIQKLFPELVYKDSTGILSVDYIGMIPLLVNALKEQKTQIDVLTAQAQNLNTNPKKVASSISSEIDPISYPVLDQNIPNPFSSATLIGFYLPTTINVATIYVYDMNGVQLKNYSVSVRGKGNITIQGSEFNAGMYLYALIADGKVIDTKRMILTK